MLRSYSFCVRGGSAISNGAAGMHRCLASRPDPDTSMLDTASDFFVNLRWKAANALTSTLSSDERDKLLETMSPKVDTTKKNDNELKTDQTVAEAVAAAKSAEAQKNQKRWEKEKEKHIEEAEQAARARVESELSVQKRRLEMEKSKIAFQQWQEELENSKTTKAEAVTTVVTEENVHPVLGPCILDLGYKRMHLVSAKTLGSITVWEKQRIYRHARASAMATDKLKSMHLGIPGVIGLHEDKEGKLSILDGQHRVGMFSMLAEKLENGEILDRILVEVFPQNDTHDDNHAQELFLEVNKAESVKLVDMPGVAKASDRKLLTAASKKISEAYPEMFKASQRCRSPHLNVDNLRDNLFASNVISRQSIKTNKELEAWILEQNDVLAEKYKIDESARSAVPKTALAKAEKNRFYLGLESSWLYK